jgi:TolB-like protein
VRLAVLPLENLSPDPANTFFADGLHEEILSALAQRAPSLQVISRTTMMLYRQHPKPLTEVAKELGATHVIEGSVRREAQQIRLTLQLIDARSDQHIWAQTYDRTLAHSLTLQSEVANQVASHLAIELKAGGSAVTPSSYNPEAYDLYLKALGARNALAAMNGAAPDGVVTTHSILDAFTRAIHQDPTLAPAYAERVFQHLFEINSGGDDERAVRLALEDLETAERLAPTDPKIIAARAWYRQLAEQDPEGALQTFAAAEAAGLTDPDVMFVKSFALIGLGRTDESIRFVQRLLTVDPRNRLLIGGLAFLQAHNRQPIEALRTAELGIRQLPETPELKKLRAQLIFDYSGDLNALNSLAPGDNSVATKFYQLRLGHQYAQLERVLARAPPLVLADGLQFDAGPWPIARLRGWTCLLLGHTSQARSNGRALLDIVAHQKDTKWNRGHLRILAAEGHVLAGEHAEAVVAGQEGLRLFQGSKSAGAPLALIEVSLRVAAVYAWSGAQDQAVELLENVAKSTPAPGPLRIARDPLYTVPLAQNARFQHLVSDLEAQARATRLD